MSASRVLLGRAAPLLASALCCVWGAPARAQNRFTLRAEPDVIPANGISTTSIFVQLPQNRGAISAAPIVHFATTAGVIEGQAQLTDGVARVLLRSSATPGTAIVTAFIGSSREAVTVEFSEDSGIAQRYLEVSAPYVAYGADSSLITSSGKTGLDFGDTHIESDVRLDVDLASERVWAQGNKGGVVIRQGSGAKAKELRGDRLFYDLRRKRGVIRRAEAAGIDQARQEFIGNDFAAPPAPASDEAPAPAPANAPGLVVRPAPRVVGEAANDANASAEAVKPPLPPSPALNLENEANRGSVFVAPAAPPTAPEIAENKNAAALTPPQAVGEAKDETGATPPANENEAASTPDAPQSAPQATQNQTATPNSATNDTGAENPPAVTPDSLAAVPQAPQGEEARSRSLVNAPKPNSDGEVSAPNLPAYAPLPAASGAAPRIVELPPPAVDASNGYWVAARRLRVFPRDKVQFERASIFFNGKKAFGVPIYVLPLDGSFNPTTDTLSFNSSGGPTLKLPFYYQASRAGTGAVYLRRDPGNGFSTQPGGFSLALDQQYWLSPRAHGRLSIDQLGNGAWNLNFQHETQLSPNTTGAFYLNMPRHQDLFARASVSREMSAMQVGFEGFFDKPEGETSNLRGQFFARIRPHSLGRSGWSYNLSANALGVQRITRTYTTESGGGGVGVPGQGGTKTYTVTRPLFGQTVTASLQSPLLSPWRGAGFSANLLSTAFNYSDGRRGFAPGVNLSFAQKLGRADLRLDYTYDRASLGLYGATSDSFTHYVSGSISAQLGPKLGVSSFLSRSLNDSSTYGNVDLDYFFAPKWRAGLFTDYSSFASGDALNYGWSVGRAVGAREVSVNYDAVRGRVYLELGNARY